LWLFTWDVGWGIPWMTVGAHRLGKFLEHR
jgi:hypothetical protein